MKGWVWKDTQNLKAKTGLSTFHSLFINHQQVFCTDIAHESNNREKLIRLLYFNHGVFLTFYSKGMQLKQFVTDSNAMKLHYSLDNYRLRYFYNI